MARAETPTHFIAIGLDRDLNKAMKQALSEAVQFIQAALGFSFNQALSVDCQHGCRLRGEPGGRSGAGRPRHDSESSLYQKEICVLVSKGDTPTVIRCTIWTPYDENILYPARCCSNS